METVGSRIKTRRRLMKLTQKDLAEWIGISASAVTQWENDITSPSGENLLSLAKCLECSPQWVLTGKGELEPPLKSQSQIRILPIISWVQAGEWTESGSQTKLNRTSTNYVETSAQVSANAFALKVVGDSMTSSGPISIPEGAVVIVEPEYGYLADINNKIVIARLQGSNEATIKKLVVDGPNKYLLPLNPLFKPIEINGNCQIVGLVKQIVIDLH